MLPSLIPTPPRRSVRLHMFAGSLLVGFAILLVAVWLEHQDSVNQAIIIGDVRSGSQGRDDTFCQAENRYYRLRRRWRMVIHGMLATCGALIIAAGWAGQGPFWIAAWTAVFALMLCIMVLAVADAIRTHHHYLQVRRESRRKSASASARPSRRSDT